VLADVWGCPVVEGTLLSWRQEAAAKVEPTVQHITKYVAASPFQHADETGVRLEGKLRLPPCQEYPLLDASRLASEAWARGGSRRLASGRALADEPSMVGGCAMCAASAPMEFLLKAGEVESNVTSRTTAHLAAKA
jgi:hypothetical protein